MPSCADAYQGSVATGENLFSVQDARNLIRYGGMRPDRDWIQLDPALSYGLTHYLDVIAAVEAHGWSRRRLIPHGGHQLALNIAAGLQTGGSESYPGVFQPYGGFADDIPIVDGYVRLPEDARHRHGTQAHHVRRHAQAFGIRDDLPLPACGERVG